jgi:integrase
MPRKPKDRRRRFGWVYARKSALGAVTWYVQWREGPRGKRNTRAIGEKESDAKDFLDKVEARLRLGTYVLPPTAAEAEAQAVKIETPKSPPLVAYSEKQIAGRLAVKADATRACYRANHLALAAFFGERTVETGTDGGARTLPPKRLDEISVTDAIDYRAWRKSVRFVSRKGVRQIVAAKTDEDGNEVSPKAISASAANRDLQYLSMVLGFAVAERLIPANPLVGLKMEREERRVRRYLSKSEVTKLILACDPWLRPLVVAALFTGCRGGELKALRWGDVNFENAKVTIYRAKVRRGDVLDLHPVLADELRRARAATIEAKRKDPERIGAKDDEPVFVNRHGEPYLDVRNAWARAIESAGLSGRAGLTFHALRHTFATHFLSNGGAVTDLQGQLGHSKLATTQVYAAMVNERRRETVLALDYGALTQRAAVQPEAAGGESGAEAVGI